MILLVASDASAALGSLSSAMKYLSSFCINKPTVETGPANIWIFGA
jgi:hypothetical protein